jgi:chromosome segregation ATPase
MDALKFGKILSLAASDNEAEALRAIQAAKRMLTAAGLDFVDLANLATAPAEIEESGALADLREKLLQLRRENRQLKGENRRLRASRPIPELGGARDIEKADRRSAAEKAARERAEVACAQLTELIGRLEKEREIAGQEAARLTAEVRRLNAAAAHQDSELQRSKNAYDRLAAEVRKLSLEHACRPKPRRTRHASEGQYSLL